MTAATPTPQDARSSLDEAGRRAATIHRADRLFRTVLLVLAAFYVVTGALLSANPGGGNVWIGRALFVVFFGGLFAEIYLTWRIRAWSRPVILWFLGFVAVFVAWNAGVVWASVATGWWGPYQTGIHFEISVVVAVIPLLIAAWLIGRR